MSQHGSAGSARAAAGSLRSDHKLGQSATRTHRLCDKFHTRSLRCMASTVVCCPRAVLARGHHVFANVDEDLQAREGPRGTAPRNTGRCIVVGHHQLVA